MQFVKNVKMDPHPPPIFSYVKKKTSWKLMEYCLKFTL